MEIMKLPLLSSEKSALLFMCCNNIKAKFVIFLNKRVRNLAVSKEPWDLSEVIRDKHRINKNKNSCWDSLFILNDL